MLDKDNNHYQQQQTNQTSNINRNNSTQNYQTTQEPQDSGQQQQYQQQQQQATGTGNRQPMSVVRMSKTKENCSDGCADISNCLEDNAPILGGTFCVAALIIAIVLLSVSFETISSSEVGLAYDNVWASLNDKILTEGLVSKPPFGSVLRWPKLYQTVSYTNTTAIICNSLDGIKITLDFSFQFVPDTNKIYNLTLTFKDFPTYSDVIQVQARSSARDVCGDFTAEEFQTRRAEVGQKLEEEVKTKIKQIWFSDVVDLQLRVSLLL